MMLGDTPEERLNSYDEETFEYTGMYEPVEETVRYWGNMEGMIIAVAEGAKQGYKEVQWLLEDPKSTLIF